jgi:serine-type D-Ala-D-Ala carboxypeptidase (penicillin-binding protein 5/6)
MPMLPFVRRIFAFISMTLAAGAAFAQPSEAPFKPGVAPAAAPLDVDSLIVTPARQLLLMDYETGEILYEKDGETLMKPASMAKLMTVAVLFDKIKKKELGLDTIFVVSEAAWRISVAGRSASSKMFLEVNSKVRLEDLLRGIIIQSGNDATMVAAEGVAGSEAGFAQLMNEKSRAIGMTASTFRNSSGLPDPDQWVTARDLAVLARYIISEHPQLFRFYAEREFTFNGIKQGNRNPLLGKFPGADGMKTGHTDESGYGLVGTAIQNGRRIIMVINGLTSMAEREQESMRVLALAFREFRSIALFEKGDVVAEAEVFGGVRRSVPLIVNQRVAMSMRRAAREQLKAVVKYDGPLNAPVARGQKVGTVTVSAPGAKTITAPVFAGGGVQRVGIWGSMALAVRGLIDPPGS